MPCAKAAYPRGLPYPPTIWFGRMTKGSTLLSVAKASLLSRSAPYPPANCIIGNFQRACRPPLRRRDAADYPEAHEVLRPELHVLGDGRGLRAILLDNRRRALR